jgi:hypothetical protein
MAHVTDKRRRPAAYTIGVPKEKPAPKIDTSPPNPDPLNLLLRKTIEFIYNQPEYYEVLRLPRPVRKQFETAVGKAMSRFPQLNKVSVRVDS